MSRLRLTLKNGWIALVFQLAYIVTQFFSRNIFLEYLGDDFVGTEGTLKSILMFLNLSELGIGTAVGFALYKPLFNKDREKINELIGYLGYLYKRIGLFVLLGGVVLILFFPLFFDDEKVNIGIVIFLFLALLTSNLINYFFTYHMFLLEADQRGYINTTINRSTYILKLVVQCFVLIYLENIIVWISIELLSAFLYALIFRKRIRKAYPWLHLKFEVTQPIKERNRSLLTKIKQISFHKLGSFVSTGTDNILIFALINPATVAYVGNYQMVMNNINILVSKLFEGTKAGVGNLVAENNLKNTLKVFWEMMALRFFFAGSASLVMYIGFDDFIILWLGEKYILSETILLALVAIFFILQIRQPVDDFKQAYGLFDDIWSPVVQSVLNLILSVVLVLEYGIIGVFIGTIVSQVAIVLIWRPYFLFTSGMKISSRVYWKGFLMHLIYLSIAGLLFLMASRNFDMSKNTGIFELLVHLIQLGMFFSCIYFLILLALSKGFRHVVNRFYGIIKNKL
ncbi:lipopolysaccharide biosynthesis protein [Flagellimonas olearia]|uniref:Sugar transporter n=1 Tax=Flagellimonas olearia TaxID=552546 RepID=A0A444VKX0_9FLAO|nr:hypothetical protein [Allomuricauda olearia]RYC51427.1 hypothetical protein DN53_14620 [Allomuricauda olearia]